MPFFSIIVPTYNRAELIQPTLNSILAQTFSEWECIVVDDGSTDRTPEVIQKYCTQDKRFLYVYQENAERSAARNNGIRHAQGEWICFLDSDDLYESTYLEELSQFILKQQRTDDYLIFSDAFLLQNDRKIKIPAAEKAFDSSADWFYLNPVSTSRVCVSKNVFNHFNFLENIWIGEDTILWVSILTKFKCLHLNKHLIVYRAHDLNSVAQLSGSCFNRYFGLKTFFKNNLSQKVSSSVKQKMLSETEFRIAEYFVFHKKPMKALYYSLKSIFTDFNHEQRKMRVFFVLGLIPGFHLIWRKIKS